MLVPDGKVQGSVFRSRYSGPPSVFRPDFRRRWNHGFSRIGFDDGAFGRAIHQTDRALWIDAALVDFQKMLRRRGDDNGIDIDLAAHDITHAAFGAFLVIDF
jgi:hypothetical protein